MRSLAALAPAVAASLLLLVLSAPNLSLTPAPIVVSTALASADPVAAAERALPEPRGRPVVVRAPAPTEAPAPATPEPAAQPPAPIVATVAAIAPAAQSCQATFFCYPRLGIAGAIVPYDDCSGTTDVGLTIRQITCLREGIWLAGHAYTHFGGITGFRVGEVVFVRGQRFVITGSILQRACAPTTRAVAPLSLQTSLEAAACGYVLVVQGR